MSRLKVRAEMFLFYYYRNKLYAGTFISHLGATVRNDICDINFVVAPVCTLVSQESQRGYS